MSKAKIIGELAVVAYKAIVGKQDPFVIFRLAEVNKKTKTDYRGGQHPVWDDQVNLPVPDKKRILTVQVYDEDSKREELISECEVDLTKVLEEGEYDDWFPLTFKSKPAGKIYLEMTFYSARPPPQRQPTRYGKNTRPQPVHSTPLATSTPAVNNQPYPPDSIRPNIPQSESQSTPTFNTPIPQAQSTYPLQYPPFHAPGNQYLPPSTSTPVVNQAHTSSYPTPSLPGHSQLSPYPTPSLPGQPNSYHSGLGGSNAFDNNSSVHAPLLSSSYTPAQKPYPPQGK
ncbi:C2 domain-containing protein [Pilobolus umbonatus]|nr:C2 domain-containing protein [Pilobolus umbonatus]